MATAVVTLCYCWDICSANKELVGPQGQPLVNDLRSRLNKLQSIKHISLKQALLIINFLIQSRQQHFVMAPLTSVCVEYDTKLPWEADSIARMIHLLAFVIIGDRSSVPLDAQMQSQMPANADNNTSSKQNTKIVNDTNPAGKTVFPPDGTAELKSTSPTSAKGSKEPNSATFKLTSVQVVESSTTVDWTPLSETPLHRPSPINHSSTLGRVKILANKAAELWRSSPRKSHHPDHKFDLYHPDFHSLAKVEYPISSNGDLDPRDPAAAFKHGEFSYLTIDSASSISGDMVISVGEFALACLAGWEAEYESIQEHIKAARISTKRR